MSIKPVNLHWLFTILMGLFILGFVHDVLDSIDLKKRPYVRQTEGTYVHKARNTSGRRTKSEKTWAELNPEEYRHNLAESARYNNDALYRAAYDAEVAYERATGKEANIRGWFE